MNPKLLGIQPSVIRALAAKKKPDSIDLGLGEPTLKPQLSSWPNLKPMPTWGLKYPLT